MPFDGTREEDIAVANKLQEMADYFRENGFCYQLTSGRKHCFIGAAYRGNRDENGNTPTASPALRALYRYVSSMGECQLKMDRWTDERAAAVCELAKEDVLKGI